MEINIKRNKKKRQSHIGELLTRDISFGGNKLPDKQKERFYNEISVLLSSGIDLASSLKIIVQQEKKKKYLDIYNSILNDLIKGKSFSESLEKTGYFSGYEFYSVKIGEESGTLQTILNQLAEYYKTRMQQRRQVVGALTYPIVVMVVAVGAVGFMLNVIVPMFADIFKRLGGELPALTQKILNISGFMSSNFIWFLAVFIGIIVLFKYLKKFTWYRNITSALLLKIPVLGNLTKKIYLSRFCSSLQLLTKSRASIVDSMELIDKMLKFHPLNFALKDIRSQLIKGESLNESMLRHKIFEIRLISLVKVGEETGRLDELLLKLYEQYTEEIKYQTGQLGNLMEPLLIVGVGLMVMVILIAMYLPLFQLSTTIIH